MLNRGDACGIGLPSSGSCGVIQLIELKPCGVAIVAYKSCEV